MALCEKILIAGFSGAGKTSLLESLKNSAPDQWTMFSDLDQLILQKHGKGHSQLAKLIEEVGWEKFRLWERQCFEGWLKEEVKGVLALGGGTLSPLMWELFGQQKKLQFCYLQVPFELAWQRLIQAEAEPRPLLKLGKEKLHELFQSRELIFNQITLTLDGRKSSQQLATELWQRVG